jgi:hypothetical protein
MKRTKQNAGLQVFPVGSPMAMTLLTRNSLTPADINDAIARYIAAERQTVGTLIGVTGDGLFASETKNWNPDLPDAFAKPLIFIPWAQILELLGRIPDGATGKLFNSRGTQH